MKLHYIVDREVIEKATFPHYRLPIANNKFLVAAQWKDDVTEMRWCETPGVIPLPHPVFEADKVISEEHLQHLRVILPIVDSIRTDLAITIHDILREAAQVDPAFRCRVI